MKRAAPYLTFAGVTLAVFWKFLFFGYTMYAMNPLELELGRTPQEPGGWFRSSMPHARVSDNLVLLAGHLRLYNEGLKANELRLWNPYLVCGLPTYADPMLHPFYPPQLLLHRIFSPDTAYELGLMLHLFASGAAMYLLLRTAGRTMAASTGAGLVWMLGGYQGMWFSTSILAGLTVFGPLAYRFLLQGLETRDRSRAALAGLAMGMAILGSHPQHAALLFLFLIGYLGDQAARTPPARRFILGFSGLFILLSLGVGLAEILARLDTIEHGYRESQFDRLALYVDPWRLSTYAAGLVLGKVYFPPPGWESEFPVYAGLAATGLATVGALRRWSHPRVRYAAIVGIAGLGMAFLYPLAWLYTKIPLLNLSPPSRCLILTGFSLALLSAEGIDALAEGFGRAPRGAAWVLVSFTLVALIGVGPVRLRNGAALETLLGFGLATGAAFAGCRSRRLAAGLGLAALLFELLPPFMQFNAHSDSGLLSHPPEALSQMRSGAEPWRGTGLLGTRATSSKSEEWARDLIAGNNLLALYGVQNIGGFEAILPRDYVAFAEVTGNHVSPAGRSLQFTHFGSSLVDSLALRRVLIPPGVRMPARFQRIGDYGTVSLFDNPAALPRARFVPEVRVVPGPMDAERELRDPSFDAAQRAVVESEEPLPASPRGRVTWKEEVPDRLRLEVSSDQAGVLVVSDTDYPGWEAFIDGLPSPIRRANLAFRSILVPAGHHRVEFRFRPAPVRQGLIASSLFLLLSGALAWAWRRA